jgi:V-type H+-transporting ATPase subunit a
MCFDTFKLESVSSELASLYKQFLNFRDNNRIMIEQRNRAIEEKFVAIAASSRQIGSRGGLFSVVAGVLPRIEQERFARTIFRTSRGNAYSEFFSIPDALWDDQTEKYIPKCVFVVYHQGIALSDKISKLATSFNAHMYMWPETENLAISQIRQAEQMMEDKNHALRAYDKFLADELVYLYRPVAGSEIPLINAWNLFFQKEKGVYAILDFFEGSTTLRADCWFPANEEGEIKRSLFELGGGSMLIVDGVQEDDEGIRHHHPDPSPPPTYIRTNCVTSPFQEIVDTYGIPRYKEINPAIFSVVSFPFLFGIMFGDFGHGMMVLMVGIWAVMNAGTVLEPYKWLLFAMGFFSVFAGLIYSEFFAIGINLFGSRWSCPGEECVPTSDSYPFGLDPAWLVASNQLIFVNSMKMKIAVLFGVAQMLLGLGLKVANSIFFKNKIDLVFECIPQIMFLVAFFGYMDWMIMYKWVTPMESPPGLIDTMITMMLGFGEVRTELYSGQESVQKWLVKIIILCVPIILIPKPAILWFNHWRTQSRRRARSGLAEDRHGLIGREMSRDVEEDSFDISEVMIHQAIETIEFVLGTVSHTASYLRLWALSLAHQQLSLVFLQKILFAGITSNWPIILNGIPTYIAFACFISVTVGILMCMDVMECFLHTLRLHWVEFQSKFYKGDGVKFAPYTHKRVMSEALAGIDHKLEH